MPATWYYLSFASRTKFLGACIVAAPGPFQAPRVAYENGINPGGEVLIIPTPGNVPGPYPTYKLLTREDLRDGATLDELYLRGFIPPPAWAGPALDFAAPQIPAPDYERPRRYVEPPPTRLHWHPAPAAAPAEIEPQPPPQPRPPRPPAPPREMDRRRHRRGYVGPRRPKPAPPEIRGNPAQLRDYEIYRRDPHSFTPAVMALGVADGRGIMDPPGLMPFSELLTTPTLGEFYGRPWQWPRAGARQKTGNIEL